MNPFGLLVIALGGLLVYIALGLGSSSSGSGSDIGPIPGSTGGVPNTTPGSPGSKKLVKAA